MENVMRLQADPNRKHKNKIRKSKQDKVFNVVNTTLIAFTTLLFIYPLIFVVSASFTKPVDVLSGKMFLFPTSFTLEGYKLIMEEKTLWTGFFNSIVIVFFGTLLNLIVTFTVGYAMSRKDFFAKKFFMFFFVFAMFFGGGLVPVYLLISETLKMDNSLLALIIPGAVSSWNIILAKTYFSSSIPGELLDAAKIDGCSNVGFFVRIAIPLAKPIIAVIALYNIVGRWNSYFDALIYLQDENKYPLQLVIRNLLSQNQITHLDPNAGQIDLDNVYKVEGMKYGVIIISTLPMLVIYPFVQKYFVKGVMVGSIKG